MWGKTKAKKCPDCQGQGITLVISGYTTSSGINATQKGYTLCSKCRGVGIVGIKQLESLTPAQLANLTKGKTFDYLYNLLNGKTKQELQVILAGC